MEYGLHLNKSYQYDTINNSTSKSNSNRRVSLSLSDLISSDGNYSPRKQKEEQIAESSDYKRELVQLLEKSRGTSYERTLKKFVENKYREIQADEEAKTSKSRSFATSLASLSTSKYDQTNRPSVFDDSILNERKNRLEEMSKPMDRQTYKGPDVTNLRVSTNHLGRQRPSPLKPKPYELSPKSSTKTLHPENSVDASRFRHHFSSSYHSHNEQSSPVVAPKTPVVSVQEFSKWLQKNKEWQQKHKEKVEAKHTEFNKTAKEQAKPMIIAKSLRLAEAAKVKETQLLLRNRSNSSLLGGLSPHKFIGDDGDAEEKSGIDFLSSSGTAKDEVLSVYDRLGERGKQYAHLRLSWEPPSDSQPHAPVILERSRRLARGRELRRTNSASRLPDSGTSRERHSRSYTPTRSRDANNAHVTPHSFLHGTGLSKLNLHNNESNHERQQHSKSPIHNKSRSSSDILRLTDLNPTRSTSEVTTVSVSGALDSRQGRGRSSSRDRGQSGQSSVDITALAISGINRTRSLSASRRQQEEERLNRKRYIKPDTVVKPFQPTLVAKETHNIMSRVKSSFEERNLKSVDNMCIHNIVVKRLGNVSPGPGQYPNAHNATVSPNKTLREVKSRMRSSSPVSTSGQSVASSVATLDSRALFVGSPRAGSKGYSFDKEKSNRLVVSTRSFSPASKH